MTQAEEMFLAQLAIGVFSISNAGQVWRHRRLTAGSHGETLAPPMETAIEPRRAETSESHNHLRVQMIRDGKKVNVYAHRVVWMVANQSDIPKGLQLNHKDGNPRNNHPDNLELVTPRGNVIHAIQVLQKMKRKGGGSTPGGCAKLTPDEVREIRALCEARTLPQRLIARQFGVRTKTVQDIFYRRTWKELV
jgi:hypothetical protein